MKKPTPQNAIITGIGVIAFALFYLFMGIFPFKSGWRWHVVTAAEDPSRFALTVMIALAAGLAALVWGILNRR